MLFLQIFDETGFKHRSIGRFIHYIIMKGKTKLGIAFAVLALVFVGLLTLTTLTEASPKEQASDATTLEEAKTQTYAACGGIEGCRTSCGCGCRGNPNSCVCG